MSAITREFTKEQLIEKLQHRISVASGFPESEKAQMDLELARIALVSLEAKPVSVNDDMAYAFHHAISDSSLGSDEVEEIKAGLRAAFANVTAPPAPASVPEWTNEQCLEFLSIAFRHAEIKGDLELDDIRLGVKMVNGSRAAMLQGAEPVTTAYKLPEGWVAVPVNATRAMIDAAARVEEDGYDAMHKAMIAAAPQQEVKP
ncbi:hypothetical protein [Enterobacter cloacae]|uniref:hypothetical protein n=1 Tax=Enterobacter cloacae TaxID=550 RepID=UPI00210ED3CF|nr:hypothetical protein [Enterobacter cloacae]MCQ4387952.1 hypothetical protein [Enterobacter cloacae]HDC4567370.1 hypothetical protein [Enterobacter cloacae]HDC4605855.1 hypothetical protein [Enterobacter cloacae]